MFIATKNNSLTRTGVNPHGIHLSSWGKPAKRKEIIWSGWRRCQNRDENPTWRHYSAVVTDSNGKEVGLPVRIATNQWTFDGKRPQCWPSQACQPAARPSLSPGTWQHYNSSWHIEQLNQLSMIRWRRRRGRRRGWSPWSRRRRQGSHSSAEPPSTHHRSPGPNMLTTNSS